MKFQPQHFYTSSLKNSPRCDDICKVLAAGIDGANPRELLKAHVTRVSDVLIVGNSKYELSNYQHVYVIGAGKACIPMAGEISEILEDRITGGLLITHIKTFSPTKYPINKCIDVLHASHPVPDQSNLKAGFKLFSLKKGISKDDLVIILLSGGSSALLMKPPKGISIQEISELTAILLRCGASIDEINTLRKHIDEFKGGRLGKLLYPSSVITLVLSDVIGDDLEVIGSGPTCTDPTTFKDALAILAKYQIIDRIPESIYAQIMSGIEGNVPETIKPGDESLKNVSNLVIGNNSDAVNGAKQQAEALGFSPIVITTSLCGEASRAGADLINKANNFLKLNNEPSKHFCFLAGGETTVTVKGNGLGGRNQELVLGAIESLALQPGLILISLATDGMDGPTEAAGAVASSASLARAREIALDTKAYLGNNDSYHFFEALDDLIKIGPTLTNVNDLAMLFPG